ncbi:hypothetical protein KA517_04525 [Candidatus Gracilibacteria bacterium]|nr:hypothetical protein [Candidatus Gracilibacteria bacterium]
MNPTQSHFHNFSFSDLWRTMLGNNCHINATHCYLLKHTSSPQVISELTGVTLHQAKKVAACLEVGKRIYQTYNDETPLTSPINVYNHTRNMIHAKQEMIRAFYLNSQLAVVRDEIVALGTLNAAQVNVRDLFRPAFLANAHTFIIVHNHPSGDPVASPDDLQLTEYIASVGQIMAIPLQDHLVVSNQGYTSIRELHPQLFPRIDGSS